MGAAKDLRPRKIYAFKAELSADQIALVEIMLEGLAEVWNRANVLKDTARLIHRNRKARGGTVAESATFPDNKEIDAILSKMRAKQYWPGDSIQQLIPTPYRDSTIKALQLAWSRFYKDCRAGVGAPKFKSQKRPIQSLIDGNGATTFKVFPCQEDSKNAWVQFPRPSNKALPWIGKVKIKGFYKRFPGGLEYGRVALVKDGNDWFMQFTAVYTPVQVERQEARAIGVDPGVKVIVATSDHVLVQPRRRNKRLEQRHKRLQRKLARQQKGSASSKKTKRLICGIYAKVRRSRKAYNAYLADWLGRFNVAFEGSQLRNMTRKAKPKPNEEGTGYLRNGASAKSGLNREILNQGIGQLRDNTEQRCKSRGRTFIKTDSKDVMYSSKRCHCCGEKGRRPRQEVFICLNQGCGLFNQQQHADVNAAKNHLKAGFNIPSGIYPSAIGEVKQEESRATVAGQPDSGLSSASLATVKESSPEAQALGSEKENMLLLTAKGNRRKRSRRSSSDLGACVSQHKGSRRFASSKSTDQRSSSEVLEFPAQEVRQLGLWDTRSAEDLLVNG